MNTTRRGLFGKLLGAAALPVAAKVAQAAPPESKVKVVEMGPTLPRTVVTLLPGYYYFTNNTAHEIVIVGAGGCGGSPSGTSGSGGSGGGSAWGAGKYVSCRRDTGYWHAGRWISFDA